MTDGTEQNPVSPTGPETAFGGVTSGVWPPPPTLGPPVAIVTPSPFVPVRRLSRAIVVLLSGDAVMAAVGIAGALLPLSGSSYQAEVAVVATTRGLLLLGMGICFLVWTYRLNRNLRAFGVAGVRYAPVWTVAYFFVPILSLYRPYQVFREIWQASDPGPAARTEQAWQNLKSPALLGFWWVSVISVNILDVLSSKSAGDKSIDVTDNAAGLLSALLALQVVRLVTARQEGTARLLSFLP